MTVKEKYHVEDLVYLMSRLRKPDTGCPWDLEQDYSSITPSTIEEAYEVVDAIERGDYDHLKEELGDLLFQVVFYAQLAREESRYDFSDVVDHLTAKLIRRHPHVFPEGSLESERSLESTDEQTLKIAQRWEEIKAEERLEKGHLGILDDVPNALPALQRAQKLQKRVAKAGMDWRSVNSTITNLEGEIEELKQAISKNSASEIEDELGDVLFSVVNIARHLKLDANKALSTANRKFEQRIRAMESLLEKEGRSWSDLSDSELDTYWARAKATLSNSP